jgi:hypothetical protein
MPGTRYRYLRYQVPNCEVAHRSFEGHSRNTSASAELEPPRFLPGASAADGSDGGAGRGATRVFWEPAHDERREEEQRRLDGCFAARTTRFVRENIPSPADQTAAGVSTLEPVLRPEAALNPKALRREGIQLGLVALASLVVALLDSRALHVIAAVVDVLALLLTAVAAIVSWRVGGRGLYVGVYVAAAAIFLALAVVNAL